MASSRASHAIPAGLGESPCATESEPGIAMEGLIALQIHGGAKSEIAYRAITIEELRDTTA